MSTWEIILGVLTVSGVPTLVTLLVHARATNRKLTAEGAELISNSTVVLLGPLQKRVNELETEGEGLRTQLSGLRADLAKSRAAAQEATTQLERATRRADYWQREFELRAEST